MYNVNVNFLKLISVLYCQDIDLPCDRNFFKIDFFNIYYGKS